MTIPRNAYRLTTFLIIGHGVAAWAGKPSVQTHPWQMQTFAIHTQAPPKIDGDLSDWDFSKGAIEINGTNARENGIRDGDWDGDQDASAVCALRWDASNLYAAAQVIDDHPMPATNPVDYFAGNSPPDAPWRHDSWMLYFETIGQPAGTGRYHPKRTCPVLTHPHIGLTLATEQARNVFLPEGSDCQTRTTKTGYVIECRLPFAALGFDVREGDRLRLGHILVDVDPDQWGQIGAHFGGGYDARTWGRLRLVSEKGVGGRPHTRAGATRCRGCVAHQVQRRRDGRRKRVEVDHHFRRGGIPQENDSRLRGAATRRHGACHYCGGHNRLASGELSSHCRCRRGDSGPIVLPSGSHPVPGATGNPGSSGHPFRFG